jgi:plastocyanin
MSLAGVTVPAQADELSEVPTAVVVAEALQYVPGGMKLPQGQNIEVEMTQGTALLFANADPLAPHTLTSVDWDLVNDRPWFDTGGGESTQPGGSSYVEGIETMPVGRYQFQCRVHSSTMRGWLNVVPRSAVLQGGGVL